MAELEDFLAKGPTYQKVNPDIAALAEQQKRNITSSTDYLNQGLDKDLGASSTRAGSHLSLGGGLPGSDDSIREALTHRNQSRASDFLSTMKRDNELNQYGREAEGLRNYAPAAAMKAKVNQNNYAIAQQHQLNTNMVTMYRRAQADSVLAGVLGILGGIGGAAVGALTGGKAGGK